MKHTVATCAHLLAALQWRFVDTKLDTATKLEVAHRSTGGWIAAATGSTRCRERSARCKARGGARSTRRGRGGGVRAQREAQVALGCATRGLAGQSRPEKDGRVRVSYPYLKQVLVSSVQLFLIEILTFNNICS